MPRGCYLPENQAQISFQSSGQEVPGQGCVEGSHSSFMSCRKAGFGRYRESMQGLEKPKEATPKGTASLVTSFLRAGLELGKRYYFFFATAFGATSFASAAICLLIDAIRETIPLRTSFNEVDPLDTVKAMVSAD